MKLKLVCPSNEKNVYASFLLFPKNEFCRHMKNNRKTFREFSPESKHLFFKLLFYLRKLNLFPVGKCHYVPLASCPEN